MKYNRITAFIAAVAMAGAGATALSAPINAVAVTHKPMAKPPRHLPVHDHNTVRRGWPHRANLAEVREAAYTVLAMGTRRHRSVRSVRCSTGENGVAGWYQCILGDKRGDPYGVPQRTRYAIMRVYEDASWAIIWVYPPEVS